MAQTCTAVAWRKREKGESRRLFRAIPGVGADDAAIARSMQPYDHHLRKHCEWGTEPVSKSRGDKQGLCNVRHGRVAGGALPPRHRHRCA